MNLFEITETEGNLAPGFRMSRLEVYNWGTFDGAVWPFELGGTTSLLTGEIGSGKSTLVDGILTLLIPQPKINYNKAADAGSKERSLNSYVRGYYAKRSNESGEEEPVALRDKNKYSVLLASFQDAVNERKVTLAQVFYFMQGADRPSRFFVVAERDLSIKRDFGGFGSQIGELKKRLKKMDYVEVYNDYTSYALKFKSLFGITQEHALELFQQTVSMKKVNGITDFVRRNMLGDMDQAAMQENIQTLLSHFHDLKSIYEAIIRDKEKISLLEPIIRASEIYDQCLKEEAELNCMGESVAPYLAKEEIKLLDQELAAGEEMKQELQHTRMALQTETHHLEEEIDNKKKESWEKGGSRLDAAKKDLAMYEKDLQMVLAKVRVYQGLAEKLGLSLPRNLEKFLAQQKKLETLAGALQTAFEEADSQKSKADSQEREVVEKIAADKAELLSLQQRDSNIPDSFISVRKHLCQDLLVPETDMPFAGEIMEVKPEEQKWEGALERLLAEFGVSLLVPESLYGKVIEWMENHFLGKRLVYYRVDEYTKKVHLSDLPEKAAARKMNIKKESPFADWLTSELYHRFDHICAETPAEFKKASFALSLEGQVKTQGRRHKKDDRHRIDDRRFFVLGFSNKEKIALIKKELAALEKEKAKAAQAIQSLIAERKACIQKLTALEQLQQMKNFKDIDQLTVMKRVDRQKMVIRELMKNSDVLAKLEQEIKALKQQLEAVKAKIDTCNRDLGQVDQMLKDDQDKREQDLKLLEAAKEESRTTGFALLEAHRFDIIRNGKFTLKSMKEKNGDYNRWITQRKEACQAKKSEQENQMTSGMSEYQQYLRVHNEGDPNLTTELNPANRNEYLAIYTRIKEDDLPKLQPKFKKRLRENTIQDMAIFQSKLLNARTDIKERIADINRSLYDIDYNPGHYIELECVETLNAEIKVFRQRLKACTDNSFFGNDDTYNEQKFLEIEKILNRFGGTRPGHAEEDLKWTAMVTDVRNWFTFAVSERIRQSDGSEGPEFEHYTDSSGKSGGQKEKLAYTILAASFVYSFGIVGSQRLPTFRFTVIDEAFLKSSDESARFGLELFRQMGLQLLVVTPLSKIPTIEPFISHLGFVSQNEKRQSELRNMTIGEYRKEMMAHEKDRP